MVSDGKNDIGAAKLTNEVLDIITKVPHVVSKLTGVNITNVSIILYDLLLLIFSNNLCTIYITVISC